MKRRLAYIIPIIIILVCIGTIVCLMKTKGKPIENNAGSINSVNPEEIEEVIEGSVPVVTTPSAKYVIEDETEEETATLDDKKEYHKTTDTDTAIMNDLENRITHLTDLLEDSR